MANPTYPGVFVNTTLNPLAQSTTGITGEAVPAFALGYNRGPTVPTLVTSWQQFTTLYGGFNVSNGSLLTYAVYQYFNNGGQAAFILRVPNQDAVTSTLALEGVGSDSSTPILTISASSPGAWGNAVYVTATSSGNAGRFNLTVFSGGSASSNIVEQFVDMSMNPSDPRTVASLVNSPLSGSKYITVTPSLGSGGYIAGTTDLAVVTSPTPLTSGSDGSIAPSLGTVVPQQFDSLQQQILNLNLPGWTNTTDLNTIIAWGATRQDVMVVIDPPFGGVPTQTSAQVAQNVINLLQSSPALSTASNACLYTPYLNIIDPGSSVPGATIWVPPGGAVLGLWNSTDTSRGVQKTPAGISSVLAAISLEANFTSTDLTNLENSQINPVRAIPGSGFCVMGGRTLQPGYPSRYISVERVIMKFSHDFIAITQFALFEPNSGNLWAQVQAVLTNYLTQQMQAGVLAGNTPSSSFQVTCDSTNNTPSTAQSGILNASVAVALQSPAEFILINLFQYQGQTTATVTSGS